MVKILGLQDKISDDCFEKLTMEHLEMNRFADAAYLIIKFSFFDRFDLLKLFYDLIEANRVATAKLLLENQNSLKKKAIALLSTP